jgi:4-amino-4-deoxy-L-arabinose transferase-like glycosyltransferase
MGTTRQPSISVCRLLALAASPTPHSVSILIHWKTARLRPALAQGMPSAPALARAASRAHAQAAVSLPVLAALIGLFAVLWFWGIEERTLLHPDEGRYAEIAREMVLSGDWITPRLNGLKYFEKPPLQYWMTALAYQAFGVHAWTARLWTTLSTLLATLFVGYVGTRLGGRSFGLIASACLAGSIGYVIGGHVLTLDGGLTAMLAITFGAFVLAQQEDCGPDTRRMWMWLAWVAMAGAVLTKGLIGILIPGASLVLYSLVTRDLVPWRRLHLRSGLAIFLLIAVPWFLAVSRANPEFARFFFIHEHFTRFMSTEHHRAKAWWFFMPVLIVGGMPWMLPLLLRLKAAWREGAEGKASFSWQRFAIVWAGFVFVFFSASGSKLPLYILPLLPPLALVAAWTILHTDRRTLWRWLLVLPLLTMLLLAAMTVAYEPLVQHFVRPPDLIAPALAYRPWLAAALATMTLGGAIAAIVLRHAKGGRAAAVVATAVAMVLSAQVLLVGFDDFASAQSATDLLRKAEVDAGPLTPEAPFFQVETYDQTLPFYLGHQTVLVGYRDEFSLGLDAEPGGHFATLDAWLPEWEALGMAYALLPRARYAELTARGVPMRPLASNPTRVLVGRR